MDRWYRTKACIARGISTVFPGVAVAAQVGSEEVFRAFAGNGAVYPHRLPLSSESVFDLASMTKPLATGLLILRLIDRGRLELDTAIGDVVPGLPAATGAITIRHALTHTSGLPAIPRLERHFPDPDSAGRAATVGRLKAITPEAPPGKAVVYSCTGFQLLGLVVEHRSRRSIGRAFREAIAEPLGLQNAGFIPRSNGTQHAVRSLADRALPTELCPWRNRWVRGEVHDEGAWCLGGEAGNAGLFATLHDVLALAAAWNPQADRERLLSRGMLSDAIRSHTDGYRGRRGLSVELNSEASSAGPALSHDAYGHTGFTGTSFWIDPQRDLTIVALSSRLQYGRKETLESIKRFRRELHAAIVADLESVTGRSE